jgi:hypothetical protein
MTATETIATTTLPINNVFIVPTVSPEKTQKIALPLPISKNVPCH